MPFVFDFTLFRDSARHSGSCWETELKGDTKPGRKKNKSDQGKIQILKHPGEPPGMSRGGGIKATSEKTDSILSPWAGR